MSIFWLVSYGVLWVLVAAMGFLLLGTLRSLGRLNWRLDEMEVTRPVRMGRSGLRVGKRAPDFTLADAAGREVSLSDYRGRRVLLVFVQGGCGPCHAVAPELNRLARSGEVVVIVIHNGGGEEAREWAADVGAEFPVLGQEGWSVAKRYEMYATPFAFLINAEGLITSRGVVSSRQYLGFVLGDEAGGHGSGGAGAEGQVSREGDSEELSSNQKEVAHV